MSEWTIDITSAPGILPGDRTPEQVLEQLATAVEGNAAALGPAFSADTAAGTVSSIYQVEASSFFHAMHVGQSIFITGLIAAGLPPDVADYQQHPANPTAA